MLAGVYHHFYIFLPQNLADSRRFNELRSGSNDGEYLHFVQRSDRVEFSKGNINWIITNHPDRE